MMQNLIWYVLAAACEIGGCNAVWMWLRLGRTALWLVPAVLILIVFAVALTSPQAGSIPLSSTTSSTELRHCSVVAVRPQPGC